MGTPRLRATELLSAPSASRPRGFFLRGPRKSARGWCGSGRLARGGEWAIRGAFLRYGTRCEILCRRFAVAAAQDTLPLVIFAREGGARALQSMRTKKLSQMKQSSQTPEFAPAESVPVKIIVAVARNGVIGKGGRLPWSIPEDWNHFLESTDGGSLIVGRRCFEELLETGALEDGTRHPFIVSTTKRGVNVFPNFRAALEAACAAGRPVWICGGEKIYGEAMALADELVLTWVDVEVEGDTHFPDWRHAFPRLLIERASHHGLIPLFFRVYGRGGNLRPRGASNGR